MGRFMGYWFAPTIAVVSVISTVIGVRRARKRGEI